MSQKHFYDFDEFRIDVEDRVLLRDGEVVPLTQKAFDVLFLLVQRANRLVTKEDLMNEVWPDTFVEEGNLAQNIYTLRKALGETAGGDAYIKTVPRRGYRFEAEVRETGAEAIDIPTSELLRIVELKGKKLAEALPENERETAVATVEKLKRRAAEKDGAIPPAAPEPSPVSNAAESAPPKPSRLPAALGISAAVLLTAGGLFWLYSQFPRSPGREEKISIENLTTTGNLQCAAVSPNGQYVAYAVADKAHLASLHVRQLSTMATRVIVAPTRVQYHALTFSPDGNFIYIVSRENDSISRSLSRVPMLGDAPRRLLETVETAVSFSPDGKQFAFRRGLQDRRESALFIANADGSAERQLALVKYPDGFGDPAWSPDGKVITCSVGHAEGGLKMNVAAIRVSDGALRVLTPRPWRWVGPMAWLPGSKSLLMIASDGPATPYQVWRLEYPSGEAWRLTNDSNIYNRLSVSEDGRVIAVIQPKLTTSLWTGPAASLDEAKQIALGAGGYRGALSWLPDGRIVFDSEAGNALAISVMDADGGNQKQLLGDATNRAIAGYVTATPDGRYVVYYSDLTGIRHIWRMNADGTQPVQLTNGNGEDHPSVSPDSGWVFYTRKESAGDGKPTIWKVPIGGGAPVQITDSFSAYPSVSPDGKWIACFFSKDTSTPWRLAIVPSEGGAPAKVFPQFLRSAPVARWMPSGRAIVYAENPLGPATLWRQPVEGGAPTALFRLENDQIFGFDFSRDGKRLGYVRGRWTSNVVLIRRGKE